MPKTENKEQIRPLFNKVHLAGILAEMESKTGVGSDGVKYLSIRGAVQCDENDPAYTTYFKAFIRAKKQDGTDSKLYESAQSWVSSVTPMTRNKREASYVDLTGSLISNSYVSSDGTFREILENNIKFFNEFKEFAYDIDIEGYIKNIINEEDATGNETGRKKVTLISKDYSNNALKFEKNNILVADTEIADAFEDAGYEIGKTVIVSCSRKKEKVDGGSKRRGFGKQPETTDGKSVMIWEIVGGKEALDGDDKDALSYKQIKTLLQESDARNEQIKEEGYKGSKNSNTKKNAFSKSNIEEVKDDDDEDMPF